MVFDQTKPIEKIRLASRSRTEKVNTFAEIAMIWVEPSKKCATETSLELIHQNVSVASGRSTSGQFGHHVRFAVFATRKLIGSFGEISDEAAFVGVEADPRAEGGGVGVEIHTIFT